MRAKSNAALILGYLGTRPIDGRTCEELESILGIKHQTASAALTRLTTAKKVRPTSVVRRTSSGRDAAVYIRIEAGTKPYLRYAAAS